MLRTPRRLLREALDLWRGPPLSGLESLPFVSTQATRLNATRLAALGDRVDADLAAGHHRELISELETLVAEHSFEERFWAQLMLALYRSGSQADALRCYVRLRTLLNEELGIVPGPAVTELEKAILEQDPSLAWKPVRTSALGADADRPSRQHEVRASFGHRRHWPSARRAETSDLSWMASAGASEFVGRHDELEAARAAHRRAVSGEQLLLLVTGEPGIGKTRLTAEIARRIRRQRRTRTPRSVGRGAAVFVPGVSRGSRPVLAAAFRTRS